MYVMDTDSGAALRASHDQEPEAWTAAYVPNRNDSAEPHVLDCYQTPNRWHQAKPWSLNSKAAQRSRRLRQQLAGKI
jgi:hypothetical protein